MPCHVIVPRLQGALMQSSLSNCFCQVKKSVNSPGFVAGRRSQEPDYDEVSWRQSETPELRRAAMSPWDAAAQFGHVEPAFEHLHQSSSSFIPGQPTPHHQHSNHTSTAAVDLSSSYNHLTSPVNGTVSSSRDGFR